MFIYHLKERNDIKMEENENNAKSTNFKAVQNPNSYQTVYSSGSKPKSDVFIFIKDTSIFFSLIAPIAFAIFA